MVLFDNGIVIQARVDSTDFVVPAEFRQTPEFLRYQSYQGIARYVSWPLEIEEGPLSKALTTERHKRWFQYDLPIVPDFDYIVRYLRACQDKAIRTRILFCRTHQKSPIWETPIPEGVFLGYDYASYSDVPYSPIPDDLLVDQRIPLLEESRVALNENKLFSNEADVLRYIEKRKAAIQAGEPLEPEGYFLIYHLSEVNPEFLQR